jgi:hypothetical protein
MKIFSLLRHRNYNLSKIYTPKIITTYNLVYTLDIVKVRRNIFSNFSRYIVTFKYLSHIVGIKYVSSLYVQRDLTSKAPEILY